MAKQIKPDTPTILKRIIQEAALPEQQKEKMYKLNRHQLLELFFYLTELKKTNTELSEKITQMAEDNEKGGTGEDSSERS